LPPNVSLPVRVAALRSTMPDLNWREISYHSWDRGRPWRRGQRWRKCPETVCDLRARAAHTEAVREFRKAFILECYAAFFLRLLLRPHLRPSSPLCGGYLLACGSAHPPHRLGRLGLLRFRPPGTLGGGDSRPSGGAHAAATLGSHRSLNGLGRSPASGLWGNAVQGSDGCV